MVFTANRGYITDLTKFVKKYFKEMKQHDPEIIMLEEVNEDKSKTWLIGSSSSINKMINNELTKNK